MQGVSTRLISYRGFNSETVTSDYVQEVSDGGDDVVVADDLKSRILRLRLPKRSAINVIQKWVNEGNDVTDSQLREISKELRRCQRYKHALEVQICVQSTFLCDFELFMVKVQNMENAFVLNN